MSFPQKTFIAAVIFLFCVPGVSIAASTPTSALTRQAQIAQIQQQIAQLQAELNALEASSSPSALFGVPYANFDLPFGQYITQSGGGLRISFTGIDQLNASSAIASTSTLAQPFGMFQLNYGICNGSYCQNPSYPTQTTELWPGQSTNYLNYHITLNSLGTSTAAFTVTEPQ